MSEFQTKLNSVPSGGFLTDRDKDKKPILDVRELGIDFGGLTAVDGFNLMIGRNEITGLIGPNGAGKTKQLIELIHTSVESETGSVVCIEPKGDMTYDVSYNVRLVNAGEYNVDSFDCLRGFLCGMYAGNYDISHVFVDNLCKIAGSTDLQAVETFLHWLDRFSEQNGVKFTVTISADLGLATDGMKKYL